MGDMEEREREVSQIIDSAKELQESASSLINRISNEENNLRQRALSLDSTLKRLKSAISKDRNLDPKDAQKLFKLQKKAEKRFLMKKTVYDSVHFVLIPKYRKIALWDPKDAQKMEAELCKASYIMTEGDAATFLPSKSHGRFMRALLGPINVRAGRKDIQLKVKEEYNSFRDRTAFLFLFFPSLLLVLRSYLWDGCLPAWPVQLYQAWLLYLYTGLALRENILRVNGSDIRPWWIYHHYFAMAMALISLTWEIERQPDCMQKQKGVYLFLIWAIMQGVAMLLQNRYQRQRLYTRIAMGKARRMDVVWGETAGVDGQLWLLAPILFILQGFEAYVGMLLLKTALVGVVSEWQVIVCGILLIIMAVGNFANTVQSLVVKSKFKAKMKRTKSRIELNNT